MHNSQLSNAALRLLESCKSLRAQLRRYAPPLSASEERFYRLHPNENPLITALMLADDAINEAEGRL